MAINKINKKPGLIAGDFLTSREKQVLLSLLIEMTQAEIASSLGITIKTVSCHKRNAMRKIGVKNTVQLHKWLVVNMPKISLKTIERPGLDSC
ncbi:helix-turn-helix transcriptional regulator [Erwinia aphidicola]|uniref:helix-turn-helix domain-containing protein n=1 Tax=Erwinia aphidicola TaxID=68334 RepID=UPI003018B0CB